MDLGADIYIMYLGLGGDIEFSVQFNGLVNFQSVFNSILSRNLPSTHRAEFGFLIVGRG